MNKHLQKLRKQLKEMERDFAFLEQKELEISKASAGWHLSHNMKVLAETLNALEQSKPEEFRPHFSWLKHFVFITGYIPRGKAKAPKSVVPNPNITQTLLKQQLQDLKLQLKEVEKLPENAFFEHPFFGHLNKDQSLKFLPIHTEHHLKIIREILR